MRLAAASALRGKLEEQVAVAANCDGTVGFAFDPRTAARPHGVEVVLTVVRIPDRARKQLGTAWRHDYAAADLLDDLRGLALRIGGDDHRPRNGQHAVEPARDDVASETR